ncbi:hypothetical protein AKJ16_DCAP11430 [Drosera capensis]
MKPVKQKKRHFTPERNQAIIEELLLQRPMLIYPFPRIDQLIDSTLGHQLLSFMDAFSRYNHIFMAKKD